MTMTMSRTDALTKIRELEEQATQAEQKLAEIFAEIGEIASSMCNGSPSVHSPSAAHATVPKKKVAVAAAKKATKSDKRNYGNTVSLKQTVWNVLDRGPKDWAKVVEDLPKNADGLQISEIKEIIEKEGSWTSSSGDISTQLASHLYNLKKEGLIARTEEGRYYIVEGAELKVGKRGRKAAKAA